MTQPSVRVLTFDPSSAFRAFDADGWTLEVDFNRFFLAKWTNKTIDMPVHHVVQDILPHRKFIIITFRHRPFSSSPQFKPRKYAQNAVLSLRPELSVFYETAHLRNPIRQSTDFFHIINDRFCTRCFMGDRAISYARPRVYVLDRLRRSVRIRRAFRIHEHRRDAVKPCFGGLSSLDLNRIELLPTR